VGSDKENSLGMSHSGEGAQAAEESTAELLGRIRNLVERVQAEELDDGPPAHECFTERLRELGR
jgi:hypothetical protein